MRRLPPRATRTEIVFPCTTLFRSCFIQEADEYKDYNLAQFHTADEEAQSDIRHEDDAAWNNEVRVELGPHPKATYPEAIRTDYDIADGAKHVTLSSCLVGYFLRYWHIDCSDEGTGNPNAQHLYLTNKRELLEQGVPEWAFRP